MCLLICWLCISFNPCLYKHALTRLSSDCEHTHMLVYTISIWLLVAELLQIALSLSPMHGSSENAEFKCKTVVVSNTGNWVSMLLSTMLAKANAGCLFPGGSCDRSLANQWRLFRDRKDPIKKKLWASMLSFSDIYVSAHPGSNTEGEWPPKWERKLDS